MFRGLLKKSLSCNFQSSLGLHEIKNISRRFSEDLVAKSSMVAENSTPQVQFKTYPVKLYYFGNEDISLPTLEMIYKKKFVKKHISKPVEAEPIHSEEKFLIDIVDLTVVTTPWQNGNKKQAAFHTFTSTKNINTFEITDKCWEKVNNDIQQDEIHHQETENNNSKVENNSSPQSNQIRKMGIIFSFGKMIPESTINLFHSKNNLGIYVLHPSLLPKYRGGAPIQHTLLNQEKETGVSLIYTQPNEYDTGSILIQTKIPVEFFYRFKELSGILAKEGMKVVEKFIENYQSYIYNKEVVSQANIEVDPRLTKAKIIKDKMFVYLDFACQPSKDILKIYHAFFGSQLIPWTQVKYGQHSKLLFFENLFNANPSTQNILNNDQKIKEYIKPGSIYWDFNLDKDNVYFKTKDGWLVSSKIKLEGLNWLEAQNFTKSAFRNQKFEKTKKETHGVIIDKSKVKPPK